VICIQDEGLSGRDDDAVLEWAARQNRGLISPGVSTITAHAYARVAAGQKMPGVFEVPHTVALGRRSPSPIL
jgi:hypothetical protein